MKRSILIFNLTLLLDAFLFGSCSFDKKVIATINDGEMQWSNWAYNYAIAKTEEGTLALWHVFFYTEIENSFRTISLTMNTREPGTYSRVFDSNSEKWSNNAIISVRWTVDYDSRPYHEWDVKSATVTIHNYNKKTKAMTATLDADVVNKDTDETRHIKVDMDHLYLVGQ